VAAVVTTFDREDVLRVLHEAAPKALPWSVIAARILRIDRAAVRISDVRGVRDVCRALQSEGLVREPSTCLFAAG
jgi:hypothetical protein